MSTKQWEWSVVYQYMWTGREMLKDESVICLPLGGVRVSNEETLLMVVDAPSSQRSCWLPVRAPKWVPQSIKPSFSRTRNVIRSCSSYAFFHTENGLLY